MTVSSEFDFNALDWAKGDGLLPAVIQHWQSGEVLMLGYMSREALQKTLDSGRVTFWSRSRQRLWTKGESSGNWLEFASVHVDCDQDTLLVRAFAHGPTCHTGARTCFGDAGAPPLAFLGELDELIAGRESDRPDGSYTTSLFEDGVRRIAQKVGEEGVETALAGVAQEDEELVAESADLVYHLLVLLRARGLGLSDVIGTLAARHAQ